MPKSEVCAFWETYSEIEYDVKGSTEVPFIARMAAYPSIALNDDKSLAFALIRACSAIT